jgi:hypothetical protein
MVENPLALGVTQPLLGKVDAQVLFVIVEA